MSETGSRTRSDDGVLSGSIVIPAWNEASVIGSTLAALFEGLQDSHGGLPHVVVAANGCTDDTVSRARRFGDEASLGARYDVMDLPPVGKALAIRAAEQVAPALPRLYLDADVELPGTAARAVLAALETGAVAARPPIEFDDAHATWPVRTFYRVRRELSGVASDLCGAGVYGLSATARARFGEFPDLRADDLFVARTVDAHEVTIVECAPAVVRVPRTLGALVHTLARVYGGNREWADQSPDRSTTTGRGTRDLLGVARDPRRWLDVAVYAAIVVAGRLRARRSAAGWERDETTRLPEAS